MTNLPPGGYEIEPRSEARELAHTVREVFVALRNEGFTEQQALVIVGQMIAHSSGSSGGES